MLMRASEGSEPAKADCEDPIIKAACLLDSDECPAECKDSDEKEDTVVKSGDLAVKATAATEKKAILNEWVSDLDTITLKASEKITVNSITLERFGYSSAADVDAIWLEDGDGNKIADEKSLSTSKDTVTLKIKKEYREMDASNALTIVLRTTKFAWDYTADKAWSTIGFKVTDVEASAKNLDISDYSPYTYDLVTYDWSKVTVAVKGNEKEYNYEEGTLYEVSRLKVSAGSSILALNGITLTNNAADALELDEFVSKVKVTADGKEVSGLKYNVTKDNELVLNWDTIEVEINKNVQLVVSIAMEWLDKFGKNVKLVLADKWDLNATEKKTGARVSVTAPNKGDAAWKNYKFNGSKIKFSNTKLSSTIDAAQGSEDVVIAQGKVTVWEEVKIKEFVITANKEYVVENASLTVAWETYDASISNDTTNHKATLTFKNVIIEKSWDVELTVDVTDDDTKVTAWDTVKFTYSDGTSTSIGKNIFAGDNNGRYEDSREDVKEADVSGSISISQLKVQESKATLKNNKSQTVEFVKDETSDRTTVFEGTYTAKKSDITLREFAIVGNKDNVINKTTWEEDTTAEFYLYIDGEEVGMIDESEIEAVATPFENYTDFSDDVEVAAWKSVKVEVKAVISPYAKSSNINLDLYLRWEDKNGTSAGFAKAGLNTFKYVINGSITISDSATLAKKTVALQDNEVTVAKFTLKPSKSDSVKLDNLVFDFSKLTGITDYENDITVEVDWQEVEIVSPSTWKYWDATWEESTTASDFVKYDATDVDDINEEVEVEVKVLWLTPKASGNFTVDDAVSITLKSVNGVAKNSEYSRLVLPAIVSFDSQSSDGAVTKFRVNVEDYDGAQISALKFYTKTITGGEGEAGTVGNGATIEVSNQTTAEVVNQITFTITKDATVQTVTLLNTDFPDFFKTTDGTTLRVSKVD